MRQFRRLRRVLVVEPFRDLAEMLAELLTRRGLACEVAASGPRALERAAAVDFDLLVTELRLAGEMDGVTLLEHWRAAGRHSPVLFVTDEGPLVPREKLALDDCCASILQKPVDLDAFLVAVDAADRRVHHAHCVHRRPMASATEGDGRVRLAARDLAVSRRFYEAALGALGRSVTSSSPASFTSDELVVFAGDAAGPTAVALPAGDRGAVRRFFAAAVLVGGKPRREPADRPGGDYAAAVLDPDGNLLEAVYRPSPP